VVCRPYESFTAHSPKVSGCTVKTVMSRLSSDAMGLACAMRLIKAATTVKPSIGLDIVLENVDCLVDDVFESLTVR
jgi:hypothetical protein